MFLLFPQIPDHTIIIFSDQHKIKLLINFSHEHAFSSERVLSNKRGWLSTEDRHFIPSNKVLKIESHRYYKNIPGNNNLSKSLNNHEM